MRHEHLLVLLLLQTNRRKSELRIGIDQNLIQSSPTKIKNPRNPKPQSSVRTIQKLFGPNSKSSTSRGDQESAKRNRKNSNQTQIHNTEIFSGKNRDTRMKMEKYRYVHPTTEEELSLSLTMERDLVPPIDESEARRR